MSTLRMSAGITQGPTLSAEDLFTRQVSGLSRRTDRLFAVLLTFQWVAAMATAMLRSPRTWEGESSRVHAHVWAAILLGGAIISLPVALSLARAGATSTRLVIAVAQALMGALLIHLTDGRIETHFHVFGSLAFLAFYLDWTVLITATVVVAADHFLRGIFWPESVYGVSNPEWWRFLEHAGWVVFEDVFLIWSCVFGQREMKSAVARQAAIEHLSEQEQLKSAALEMALAEMSATA
jgi:signal transduction histidine kinase